MRNKLINSFQSFLELKRKYYYVDEPTIPIPININQYYDLNIINTINEDSKLSLGELKDIFTPHKGPVLYYIIVIII